MELGIFISSRRIVGGSGSPRVFLINGCKWCILSPGFFSDCLLTFPKIVCNFCLQISDRRYKHDSGGNFALSVEDHIKSKREFFSSRSRWRFKITRRKFLKKDANSAFQALFCRLLVNIFSKIAWDFRDNPEDVRYAIMRSNMFTEYKEGIILLSRRGVRGEGHTKVIFFLWKPDANDAFESIPSRLGVGILLKFHIFVMKALMWRVIDAGVSPHIRVEFYSLCRRSPWFSPPPPTNILTIDAMLTLRRFKPINERWYYILNMMCWFVFFFCH